MKARPCAGDIDAGMTLLNDLSNFVFRRYLDFGAIDALRELLARMGDRCQLVVYIDDLQWGDIDSLGLIAELLRPPDPPVLMLALCFRSEEAMTSPMLRLLLSSELSKAATTVRELMVDELSQEHSRELARLLVDYLEHTGFTHIELLPVMDSMAMGLAVEEASAESLREGMELTMNMLMKMAGHCSPRAAASLSDSIRTSIRAATDTVRLLCYSKPPISLMLTTANPAGSIPFM